MGSGGLTMNNYERIKNMTLDEMVIWLEDEADNEVPVHQDQIQRWLLSESKSFEQLLESE